MADGPKLLMKGFVDYWVQYAELIRDPVWRKTGVYQKTNLPIFLIPGFLAGDWVMTPLARWLSRMGYHVRKSNLLFNVGCQERVIDFLAREIELLFRAQKKRVVIIGHSLGGTQGVILAERLPDYVAHVITIGSPLQHIPEAVRPFVTALFELFKVSMMQEQCRECIREKGCRYFRAVSGTSVGLTAIFSKNDGVLDPSITQSPFADNREVRGGHIGLVVNREVYKVIAQTLESL